MTNYPIDDALAASENSYTIDLTNKVSGSTYPKAAVLGANTLEQVLLEYAADIGVNAKDDKIIFENKRTKETTSDKYETVEGLGLQEGDVLIVSDNAGVAGDDESYTIDLTNKVSGSTYPKAAVLGANTLEQVLLAYAADIGVNAKDDKIIFENKRTRESTSDKYETVEGLGLQEGDVLVISDNAGVAGDDEIFTISLQNPMTGACLTQVPVYGANTLDQVQEEYAAELGMDLKEYRIEFVNKRTGDCTRKTDTTLESFGLKDGDTLAFFNYFYAI